MIFNAAPPEPKYPLYKLAVYTGGIFYARMNHEYPALIYDSFLRTRASPGTSAFRRS